MNHLGTEQIETNRLVLRQYQMTDAQDMFLNWVTDFEVSRFWGWKPHKNINKTKEILSEWIEAYSKTDYYLWVIVCKETE